MSGKGSKPRPFSSYKSFLNKYDEIDWSSNELCVSCKKETDIKKSTDINLRHFYIEGSGQLCKACWEQTYE